MAEQNFLTVRPLSLNPDDRWIHAESIFDMFYWRKAEISADSTRPRMRGKKRQCSAIGYSSSPRHWAQKNITLSFVCQTNRAREDSLWKKFAENYQSSSGHSLRCSTLGWLNRRFFYADRPKNYIIARNEITAERKKRNEIDARNVFETSGVAYCGYHADVLQRRAYGQ